MRPCACPQSLEHVVKELHDSFEGVLVTAGNQLHIFVALRAHQSTTSTTMAATSIEFDNHSK